MNIYDRIPRGILIELYNNDNYITALSKKLDATYCHLQKIVNLLEQKKFLRSSINGRKRIITLTKKGIKVVESLKKIEEVT